MKEINQKKEFNQKEYINNYKKEHYSAFKVNLKKEEKQELDKLLKESNLTKTRFLKNAIAELKEKKESKDDEN